MTPEPKQTTPGSMQAWPLSLALFALITLAGCSHNHPVVSVYDALGDLINSEPPSAITAVDMAFNQDNADDRREGIGWLAIAPYGGEEEYLAGYRLFISDPDPGVRAAAAMALGLHGTVADAQLLAMLVNDDDAQVRWVAADALRKVHNPVVIPSLLDRLNPDIEEDTDTRIAAALALGQYPDRIVFSRLVTTLEQNRFSVVNAAYRSLKLLTGHDAGLDPSAWNNWAADKADPFANQQPYTYRAYHPTRGWFDAYVTFWNNQDKGIRTPRGLGDAPSGG